MWTASTLGLGEKGLKEREKLGAEGWLHIEASLIPYLTDRTKGKRRNISDDYKTNSDYARAKSLPNIRCHGSTITADRLEGQNNHRGCR